LNANNETSTLNSLVVEFICLNNRYCYVPVLAALFANIAIYELITAFVRNTKRQLLDSLLWITGVNFIGLLQWPLAINLVVLPVSRWRL